MFAALVSTYLTFNLASKRPVLSKMTPDSQPQGPVGLRRGKGISTFPAHSQTRALSSDRDWWDGTPWAQGLGGYQRKRSIEKRCLPCDRGLVTSRWTVTLYAPGSLNTQVLHSPSRATKSPAEQSTRRSNPAGLTGSDLPPPDPASCQH